MSDRPEVCVGAVAVVDEELLLVRRGTPPGHGRWSLPGGRIEGGELAAEAVIREVREETGLDVLCGPLLGWTEIVDEDHHFVILDFTVIALERFEPSAGSDASEARWVPLPDVADYDLVDGLAHFLHEHGVLDTIAD